MYNIHCIYIHVYFGILYYNYEKCINYILYFVFDANMRIKYLF